MNLELTDEERGVLVEALNTEFDRLEGAAHRVVKPGEKEPAGREFFLRHLSIVEDLIRRLK